MFCAKCGSELKEGALFCSKCGLKVAVFDADEDIYSLDAKFHNGQYAKRSNTVSRTDSIIHGRSEIGINPLLAFIAAGLALVSLLPYFVMYPSINVGYIMRDANILMLINSAIIMPIYSVTLMLTCVLSRKNVRFGIVPCLIMVAFDIIEIFKLLKSYPVDVLPNMVGSALIGMIPIVLYLVVILTNGLIRRVLAIICCLSGVALSVGNIMIILRIIKMTGGLIGAQWSLVRNIIIYTSIILLSVGMIILPTRNS